MTGGMAGVPQPVDIMKDIISDSIVFNGLLLNVSACNELNSMFLTLAVVDSAGFSINAQLICNQLPNSSPTVCLTIGSTNEGEAGEDPQEGHG